MINIMETNSIQQAEATLTNVTFTQKQTSNEKTKQMGHIKIS